MGGGLMQLVAYGAQDIYLTGNPQITFFKVVYRRHTNFSMETIEQTLNGTPTASGTSSVTISRNGDLVFKVYVTNDSASVTDGTQMISKVELEIGGQMIDRQYQEWMDVWNELSTPASKSLALKAMQGAIVKQADNGVEMVQVPLQFWFCRNPGLALPLIALQYHEVKLKFQWGSTAGEVASAQVWCDYIYLDTDERRRFAQVSHEYLIEQVQRESFTLAESANTLKLNFNHPVKEIIWTTVSGVTYTTAKLKLNGHDRFAAQQEEYFQLRQPFDYHTSVPSQNLPINMNLAVALSATSHVAAHTDVDGDTKFHMDVTAPGTHGQILFNDGTDGDLVEPGDILQLNNTGTAAKGGTILITKKLSSTATVAASATTGRSFEFLTLAAAAGTPLITVPAAEACAIKLIRHQKSTESGNVSKLSKGINVYSFALKPEEHQPSGTCNFSRIDNAQLELGTTSAAGDCIVYAVNYNVLRIMSGMGGLAYSN